MKYLVLLITVVSFGLFGCNRQAKPIEYGKQACDYCRMSIVDERYAAQLVSSKGKTYSFDAIECMINYKHEHTEEWQQVLVTDYNHPKKLIPAEVCWIVRSKNLPSPMGMYLTAVPNRVAADELVKGNEGAVYPYAEVYQGLEKLPAL
tara:strand:- start:5529 stop:5972 length:444 start_codon:yes stop_codon:yes gene_type:complete